eukprot:scaffold90929_cov30-Tisochrysis_lutea.AAC.6
MSSPYSWSGEGRHHTGGRSTVNTVHERPSLLHLSHQLCCLMLGELVALRYQLQEKHTVPRYSCRFATRPGSVVVKFETVPEPHGTDEYNGIKARSKQ